MSGRLGSYPFQALFESALQEYEKQTGIPLANHPLAEKLQNCQSVDSVTTVLQEQTRAFSEFQGSDRIMKSLKSVVSVLSKVSAIAALGLDIAMVCPWIQIGYLPTYVFDAYPTVVLTCGCDTYRPRCLARCMYLFRLYMHIFVTFKYPRHSRASVQTLMLLWICSSP